MKERQVGRKERTKEGQSQRYVEEKNKNKNKKKKNKRKNVGEEEI